MKERRFKLTDISVDNRLTIWVFTIILILSGIYAYYRTPKEMTPDIVFPFFSITTIYPGTSPEDMENLVTRPIETQLRSIDGIKHVNSMSIQDFSAIFVEFETDIDNNEAYQDVKEAVDKAKPNLPATLLDDPEVTKIEISEFPIIYINLSGDMGLVKIKDHAEELQDEIESLEEITRVDIVGALNREIQINVDLYKMQAAGLSFDMIKQAVAFENMTISGGQIEMDGIRRTMRVVGEFDNVEQIKHILIKPGLYLKDIAEVKDGYADRESYSRFKGEEVITLNVIKKGGENLIIAVDKIKEIVDNYREDAPESLQINVTGDQSRYTRNTVSDLFNTIILGFIVVVIVLMFFMGVDNALFVAVAIPLSMLIAFIVIFAIDFTMNMVVLAAFILVLGIVVDNSIVVVENIYRHFMNTDNLPITPATKRATGEVALPVFSGTITTMAPFFPLIFWPGIMGEFMAYIPITIIITLAASMLVAYVMNPVFAVSFMKYREGREEKDIRKTTIITILLLVVIAAVFYATKLFTIANLISFGILAFLLVKYGFKPLIKRFQRSFIPRMINGYKHWLSLFLSRKNPYWVIFGTILLLFVSIFLVGTFTPKIILFAEGEPSNVFVYIRMPAGTDIEVTDSVTHVVENKVFDILGGKDNPDVESIVSNVAIGAGQNFFERSTQAKLGKVSISFVEYKFRTGPPTNTYVKKMRDEIKNIPDAEIVVDVGQMGPPTGKPISIEITGEEIDTLVSISERLVKFIDSLGIQGIEQLKSDMETNTPEILVDIDRDKANKLGVKTAMIGMALRTALYGEEISKYREGEDEYDIRLRLKEQYRDNLQTLMNIEIMAPGGRNGVKKIPLSAVADVKMTSSYGGINRKDYDRMITLSSNVLEGYNANEIVQKLKKYTKTFSKPEGYKIRFAGEQDDQKEAGEFLAVALILAVGLILLILVAQFNSISRPMIILTQVVFSIIGVFLGLVIFNLNISIVMTGMGIIAVAGIVVKNAIILIDYTDLLIKRGGKVRDAIIEAGSTRLTPVLLTAASTILGLLPLATGININFATLFSEFNPDFFIGGDMAAFWKPLAWTIIFGLTFATFLTLIVVPSMYYVSYAGKVKLKRMKNQLENKMNGINNK